MNELIQNAVILSSPLLSLGALRFFPKHHWKIPLVVILALISLLLPIGLGVCSIAELPLLIQYTGHFQDGLIVVLIILLWTQIFTNGGIGKWLSSKWNCLLEGMCMGIVPLLQMRQNKVCQDTIYGEDHSKTEDTNRQRWMIILGMGVGVIGNPIVTTHSHESFLIFAISVIALSVASFLKIPMQNNTNSEESTKNPHQYVNLAVFFLASAFIIASPSQTSTILLLANILLLPISLRNFLQMESSHRRTVVNVLLWYISVVAMTQISIIGGSSELLSWAVEEIQFNYGNWFPIGLLLLGITLGALFDAVVMILIGSSLLANALDLTEYGQDISIYVVSGCLIAFGMNAYSTNFTRSVSKSSSS